jgi:phosphatidate cytidylyltransferase
VSFAEIENGMKIPSDAYLILAGLGGVLIAASVVGFALHLRVKDENSRAAVDNLNARIRSWWVMVILLGGASLAGRNMTIVLFGLLSFGALREFIPVTAEHRADRAASLFVVLPVQYGLLWMGWLGWFYFFIPVYALTRTSEMRWGLLLTVYCVSYIPAILILHITGYESRSVLLMAFLLIVVQSSDVLQYVFGKLFGRHKIAPEISPSKTVEGFAGGIACATAIGALLWWITPFNPVQAAAMALAIALVGFLGGLVLSAMKRHRGIKDWGRLIKGHGGILDRLDSLCLSAPVLFHLTRYFFAKS